MTVPVVFIGMEFRLRVPYTNYTEVRRVVAIDGRTARLVAVVNGREIETGEEIELSSLEHAFASGQWTPLNADD